MKEAKNQDTTKSGAVGPVAVEASLYADELYQEWQKNPKSVDPAWDAYFKAQPAWTASPVAVPQTSQSAKAATPNADASGPIGSAESDYGTRQSKVTHLIRAYRDLGYLYAEINPLRGYLTKDMYYRLFAVEGDITNLEPTDFDLDEADLDREFYVGAFLSPSIMKLRDIVAKLREIYCSTIGFEISHIQNRAVRRWLLDRIEGGKGLPTWTKNDRIEFQKAVIRAETFEHFLHQNYVGQKRFSLEGSEAMVPALTTLKMLAAREGVTEMVIGMAHRGRLNILVNALDKPVIEIFAKFEDAYAPHQFGGNGDVKYHMGWSCDWQDTETGRTVHVGLVANPSHLEAVDPVVEGKARALQRIRGDRNRKKVLPILIHGDSAFSGQGVVTETLNLSQLRGYRTGGTVHIMVNNQIGFTTAGRDSRSTFFATDTGKTIPMPILHVNGDDVDAVCRTISLALSFRQKFATDVMVDIVCYRKHGHNETDEPSFTHPLMYQYIKNHPSTPVVNGNKLDSDGVWSLAEQETFKKKYIESLQGEAKKAKEGYVPHFDDAFQSRIWEGYSRQYSFDEVNTALSRKTLDNMADVLHSAPKDFTVHPKLQRIIQDRMALYKENQIDWALGEALAFGSLLAEGHPVRLSGEDAQRGTFSHRHAVWWDHSSEDPKSHTPLQLMAKNQAFFGVYDSPLSEFAVLGFEYGYSLAAPNFLLMWEAQFGDFANGAQVIIDQFLTSGETKWFRSSGLMLLLPHGYEGQGPEHSNANIDRFLARCAEDNIQVVNVTTPAQLFHLFRRQVHAKFRKPLILFTPKSLLRHKMCRSSVDELTRGSFNYVLDDTRPSPGAKKVLISSGKVWYDLVAKRDTLPNADNFALLRIEQLYPFPAKQLADLLGKYTKATEIVWVQEENKNYGPYRFIRDSWESHKELAGFKSPRYIGRGPGASPATGSNKQHNEELTAFVNEAFS